MRPNETPATKALKRAMLARMRDSGFDAALGEVGYCDGFGCVRLKGRLVSLAAECESHDRPHILKNLLRDLKWGCDHVAVICPDEKVKDRILQRISAALSEEMRNKVSVVTLAEWSALDLRQFLTAKH